MFSLEEELLGPKQKVKTCRIFFLSLSFFFFALILKHTPSIVQYSCCIPTANKRLGCAARGEHKVTVNFCVGERLSQTMKFFFFFLIFISGARKGTHVMEHRLALCLNSHFLYSSGRVLTLRDVPSTLHSLVEASDCTTHQPVS